MVLTWRHTRVGRKIWYYILGLSDAFIQITNPSTSQWLTSNTSDIHGRLMGSAKQPHPLFCALIAVSGPLVGRRSQLPALPLIWNNEIIHFVEIDGGCVDKFFAGAGAARWLGGGWLLISVGGFLGRGNVDRQVLHWCELLHSNSKVDNSLYLHSRYYIQDDKFTKEGGNITTWGFWWCSVKVLCTCQPCVRN